MGSKHAEKACITSLQFSKITQNQLVADMHQGLGLPLDVG